MLIHRQMLQKLPIALAQVKAANRSENLWKPKEITKKVYSNKFNKLIIQKWILYL